MLASFRRIVQTPMLLRSSTFRSFSSAPQQLVVKPVVPVVIQRETFILPRIPVTKQPTDTTTVVDTHQLPRLLQAAATTVSPFQYGDPWISVVLQALNRNDRKAKRANHGKRPCSRVGRRARARRFGNPKRN
jgi:hypothetical protein